MVSSSISEGGGYGDKHRSRVLAHVVIDLEITDTPLLGGNWPGKRLVIYPELASTRIFRKRYAWLRG